jgi:YVTN family beta-propeller protein
MVLMTWLITVWIALLSGCGGGSGGSGSNGGNGGNNGGTSIPAAPTKLYVLNAGSRSISVIDPTTQSVAQTITLAEVPNAIAVDDPAERAYVTTSDSTSRSQSLVILDTRNHVALSTLPLSAAPGGVAVDPGRHQVYVATGNNVVVLAGNPLTVQATISAGAPLSALALDPLQQRLFGVAGVGAVMVIDTSTRAVIGSVTGLLGAVVTALAADPAAGQIYANAYTGNQVLMIDAATLSVRSSATVGSMPAGLTINPENNRVYVSNSFSNTVSALTPEASVLATLPGWPSAFPNPTGLAVDAATQRLYVANQSAGTVSVYDTLNPGSPIADVTVGSGPVAVARVAAGEAAPSYPTLPGLGVRWVVKTPTAASGELLSVTTDASRFVAVGRGGLIRTSTDGEIWTTQTSGTTQDLNQVAWLNGQFIAVGQAGTLLSSPDGLSWTARSSGVTGALNGLTWGAGSYWVVGQAGTLLSSADAVTWTARTLSTSADLLAIAFDPASGRMIATGAVATVLSSADSGATWGAASTNAYIAATRNSGTSSAQPARLDSAIWTGSQFVVSGGLADPLSGLTWSVVMTSADGQSWSVPPGVSGGANAASYGGGRLSWVNGQLLQAVPEMNGFRRSADALSWGYRNNHPVLLQAQDFKPVQVTYAKGLYVAVGPLQGPNLGAAAPTLGMGVRFGVGTSLDGLDWMHSAPGSAQIRSSVSFDGQRFVSRVQTFDLGWSADGTTELVRSPLGLVNPTMVTAGTGSGGVVRFLNGRYVMPDNQGRIATSTDGVHWSEAVVPGLSVNGQLTSVTWGKGLYVAVGQYATIATSPDAVTWTVIHRLPGTLTNNVFLNEVVFLNGRFLAVGQGGLLMSSSDGLTWTSSHPQAPNVNTSLNTLTMNSSPHQPNDFRSITEGNGLLVIAGINSAPNTQAGSGYLNFYPSVLASADGGQTWTERADSPEGLKDGLSMPGVVGYDRVLFGGGRFHLMAKNRSPSLGGVVLSSADGLRWADHTPPSIATLAYDFNDIAFGNNRLMVVGGSSNGGLVLTSP